MPLGRLYAGFNWQEIIRLLNSLIPGKSQDDVYYTLLVDSDGRVIATSSNLQNKIPQFFVLDKSLLQQKDSGAHNYYAPFLGQEVLVGYSRSKAIVNLAVWIGGFLF